MVAKTYYKHIKCWYGIYQNIKGQVQNVKINMTEYNKLVLPIFMSVFKVSNKIV